MVQKKIYFLLGIFLVSISSNADVLFEGYSRIFIGNKPAGYTVSRVEVDTKKNQFQSTYYLKIKKGSEISESLRAIADLDLNPISYSYMNITQGKIKTIDAKFNKQMMSLSVTENGKTQKIEKPISKNAFLSTFLIYKILKSKEGLQAQSRYLYEAIFEEEGRVHEGQVIVLKPQIINGFEAFKIRNLVDMSKEIIPGKTKPFTSLENNPNLSEFVSFVNSQGHLLQIEAAEADMRVDLTATQEEATQGFAFDKDTMKLLFGDTPAGQNNVMAQAKIQKEKLSPTPGKTYGVPPGKGILIKTNKSDSGENSRGEK